MKIAVAMLALLPVTLFAACPANVPSGVTTCFYIDSATGADTNAGTLESAPWAHAPGMVGCASTCGSNTPSSGRGYILKGGSIWTETGVSTGPFPWTIPNDNGSSGTPIYYGVDQTWWSGTNSGTVNTAGTVVTWASGNAFQMNGSWASGSITINGASYTIASVPNPYIIILTASAGTQSGVAYSNSLFKRPVLNANEFVNSLVSISNSFIVIDSMEMTGQIAKDNSGTGSLDVTPNGGNVTAENLDVHNWNICTGSGTPTAYCTAAVTDNSGSGGGTYVNIFGGLNPANVILQNSNVGNPENGSNIGAAGRGWPILTNDYMHDATQGNLHGGGLTHDNVFYNLGASFDGTTHGNVTYLDCFDQDCGSGLASFTAYVYNNWIINATGNATATLIYPNPGTSGVSSTGTVTYYIFNNVESNISGGGQIGDEIDRFGAPTGATMIVHDWNNTYQLASNLTCVNVVTRAGVQAMSVVDVTNLHCIETVAPTGTGLFSPDTTVTSNNTTPLGQATATANSQGYTAPEWLPTSGSGATVGAGTNLTSQCSGTLTALCSSTTLGGYVTAVSRPSSGAWNIGAGEFQTTAGSGSTFNGSFTLGGTWKANR